MVPDVIISIFIESNGLILGQKNFDETKPALLRFRILQLQNMRLLETYKQQWWNENPFAQNCDEYSGGDSGGGISISNIGKLK